MKSYCVKQKKVTECVPGSEKYMNAKNGRTMMKCTCAECGITKTKFVKNQKGEGILSSIADAGAELFISKGIPYLAKKGVEAGRYYVYEFMKDPKLQKKATPVVQKVGSEAIDQLADKVRPDKYKGGSLPKEIVIKTRKQFDKYMANHLEEMTKISYDKEIRKIDEK